jgi:hypothetical protein
MPYSCMWEFGTAGTLGQFNQSMWASLKIEACTLLVDVPDSITYSNWTPIFERYVICYGSKNRFQEHMCSKKVAYMITIR